VQFTSLMAWWRRNCDTLHVMKVYFITAQAMKMFRFILNYMEIYDSFW